MLPVTSAPAAEILPSVIISVELAVGSQPPLFVTMVTFQVPSKGCWAKAGAMSEPARTRTDNTVAVRFKRISQIPDVCDGRLIWSKCDQNLMRRSTTDCSYGSKHIGVRSVPPPELKNIKIVSIARFLAGGRAEEAHPINAGRALEPWWQTAHPAELPAAHCASRRSQSLVQAASGRAV